MDPNACLKELRKSYERILEDDESDLEAQQLAGLIDSLDHWLSNGGFLPKDWER